MTFNATSYVTGVAVGQSIGLALGLALNEIEPIDWKCKRCNHSWKKHKKGYCSAGWITLCTCNQFELDEKQLEDARKELEEIKNKLFKDLQEARGCEE